MDVVRVCRGVRRLLMPLALLLLAVVHSPLTAQARLFDFLPTDLLGLGSSEPVVLLLTGLALLSLGRFGAARPRLRDETAAARPPVTPVPAPAPAVDTPAAQRRAA